MIANFLIIYFAFSLFLVGICKKYNLLVDNKIEKHKKYSSNLKCYSIGGILLILFLSYYFIFISKNYTFLLFLFSIFSIGLFSDLKKIHSVSYRFFLQIILTIFFVYVMKTQIISTKVVFFDQLLENNFVNILFVTFCITILINGVNFIDGLNGLAIKYHLIIYLVITIFFSEFVFENQLINYMLIVLFILLIFNLSGYLYLGDSGSYVLSLFTGVFLIEFSNANPAISPYFIIVLLWYPCFELLFSMIRRFLKKKETYKPDTNHLHQQFFKFISKNLKIKNKLAEHIVVSLGINLYNLFSILISVNFIYNSEVLILILFTNIFFYISTFYFLKRRNY